jgi:hypothetical protein
MLLLTEDPEGQDLSPEGFSTVVSPEFHPGFDLLITQVLSAIISGSTS